MSVTYKLSSQYFTTPVGSYLDILQYRSIPPQADDLTYVIQMQYQYRPHLLAFDLYNDKDLWWVFIVRNRNYIQDPIWDFVAGKSIFIPKLSTINTSLNLG